MTCDSVADQLSMRTGYFTLLNRAVTGLPLQSMYDEKLCHEAFQFPYKGLDQKIWRIRHGKIRYYFMYFSLKRIILLKTLAKRSDKLSKAEENEISDLAKAVLDCLTAHSFEEREF